MNFEIKSKILPANIDPLKIWDSKWQNSETENGAKVLVKLAQRNGNWNPITKTELDKFAKEDFYFNYLVHGDIILVTSKKLIITEGEPILTTIYSLSNTSEYFLTTQKIKEERGETLVYFTDLFINEVYRLTIQHK